MTTADRHNNNNNTVVFDETVDAAQGGFVHPSVGHSNAAQAPAAQPLAAQPPVVQPSPVQSPSDQPNATFSITSFVLGIVSVVAGWTLVAPTVGLILGIIALRRKAPERTLALWGVWLNGAMLAISVLIAFGFMAIMAVGLFGGAYSSYWG